MKQIIGLDLGTNSIGWAVVNEGESPEEQSSIIRLGSRIIHYDNFVNSEGKEIKGDPADAFRSGKGVSPNAGRTQKRGMRRNLQRYKLRREHLVAILKEYGIISSDAVLNETGNFTTFQTYRFRAKAATEQISLEEFARVLLMINKKRGYKSMRKANSKDEGQLIDGMDVAKQLYENNQTPGQFALSLLKQGRKSLPEFYRSDRQNELDTIWKQQQLYYPEILTENFKRQISRKGKQDTAKNFMGKYQIYTADNKGKDKRIQAYQWRVDALSKQLSKEEVAFVISDLNGAINNSNGYLGSISDRSKELYFNNQTIGQFFIQKLNADSHYSLKNKVFYRQDYLDEFERLWETQALYHTELTPILKKEIRDVIIFFQRPLKSQKGLIGYCELESKQVEVTTNDGKKRMKSIGARVCPKSSPLYQEFRIWQLLNNLQVSGKSRLHNDSFEPRFLYQEEKELLYTELQIKEKLKDTDILKLLWDKHRELQINYKELKGNTTQAALHKLCPKIPLFDSSIVGKKLEKQKMYRLWHLLYSFEGDNSKVGNENLIHKLMTDYDGVDKECALQLVNLAFERDYGNLSAKAIRNLLPYMKEGTEYSAACVLSGYKHSKESLTKEEIEKKIYKDNLEQLPRNSLRNPVAEKIINQMINVVNELIQEYGKPDEIRIELARELKKNAKERERMTLAINRSTVEHDSYRDILKKEFGLQNVSRNDIIRYKLYLELKDNGYRTLYSNTYIPQEKLFSKEFDIEHIIPRAKLFDDSFSNKTIECKSVNIEKKDSTAYDYVVGKLGNEGLHTYLLRIESLFINGAISKTKRDKLMMTDVDIPSGFIERDLRDSQYITKKARALLNEIVPSVVSTTGSITDRLREDWQLVDVMQELNWDKYHRLGLTEIVENKDGRRIRRIKDWTKRNDHRHHAMDALTIAFTKPSYIQYLNNLNARSDKSSSIYAIERKELYRDDKKKLRFASPIPLELFRSEVKRHLENILISVKARNKVVTKNVNKTKKQGGINSKMQLTPRGQLHNDTIYGSINQYTIETIGKNFDKNKILTVVSPLYRAALLNRLKRYGADPKKAFTGENSLGKTPLYCDEQQTLSVPTKVTCYNKVYTIRKEVTPDLKIEKVIDAGIKKLLETRLAEFKGDARKAFTNLEENPIWHNKEKGISVKRVTITGISNAESLHDKRDNRGKVILDSEEKKQPVDYVSTSNNHHVAIYRDADGELHEQVVSLYEATTRASLGQSVVDKDYRKSDGWKLLFTMKQNEYFVFPNEATGFNPNEIDLLNPENYAQISPNLFRVQKLSTKNYMFRHHLETTVNEVKELRDITWKSIRSFSILNNIVKVRINHIGQIVTVGEY
ncbi:MAG: type II CRISPR RNA-guided endonuclease Cas9 [Mediterranea sp.]|nr:type II CRISPR RNA-guided endonuclease Cas9 [Mediterranea sp.]